jgi:hypothetical protein
MMRAAVAAMVAMLALATQPALAASTTVSSNWSGYAVSGTTYRSVSGSWTQPAANCSSTTASTSSSAFWVGLGGNSTDSSSLEQTGTEADCLADGSIRYSAWYELLPAASVKAPLTVHAGDRISASVNVNGTAVTVKLKNLTTGKSFAKTLRMSDPDISSAEWVAEAPSTTTPGGTAILPLTDFGTVRFTGATATTTGGHTGTISDSAWTATRILLESTSRTGEDPGGPYGGPYTAAEIAATKATPTALTSGGAAFSVTWSQAATGANAGF